MFVTDGYGHYMRLTVFGWIISFAPLGISSYFAFGYNKISAENAQILFWVTCPIGIIQEEVDNFHATFKFNLLQPFFLINSLGDKYPKEL